MSHQGPEGRQTFTQGNAQHRAYNQSSTNSVGIKQGNNLMMNTSMNMSPNNMMQNSAVALGIVQQQQHMPMLWKGQAPIVPNPGTNVSSSNNHKPNQLSGPYASIVPSNGMIPMNTHVKSNPPIAPGSAPNIISALEPINKLDKRRTTGKKGLAVSKSKAGKGSKGVYTWNNAQITEPDILEGKTEKNRERNREHARSTRLRKKAYVQKLKDMAHGLRAVQTKEIRERRTSMQNMVNIQQVRRAVVQTVLDYHVGNERDPAKWNVLLERSFWMKQPVTPFRSFQRSEIDRDCRIVRGTNAMICDAASVAVMIERIGCHNDRWRRIKQSDFLDTLDDRDILTEDIGIARQPESSLSSESSIDSSDYSGVKTTLKRKRSCQNIEGSSQSPKVSSSNDSIKTQENSRTNTSSSADEADKEVGRKHNETRNHPILSRAYLNRVSTERISGFYAVNQDDMVILEDVLMCPFVFRTMHAVLCGSLTDCVIPGMLRANFSKNNKLLSMELVFDAMGFMQQLDSANGDITNAQAIPSSLETALLPSPNEARVITEATPPYSIVHVNESWTRMTKYSQADVEGNPLLTLLQGENTCSASLQSNENTATKPGRLSHSLEDVRRGQPACSTCIHYNKDGKPFVDFMCSYPLTNASNQITNLLHVNMKLPQKMALIA